MKNKRSSDRCSQKVEHSRAKRKSSTETVAPVECGEHTREARSCGQFSSIYRSNKYTKGLPRQFFKAH